MAEAASSPARSRKRAACVGLRALERDIGVQVRWPRAGGSELSHAQFSSRVAAAAAAAASEEQRRRAQALLSAYHPEPETESQEPDSAIASQASDVERQSAGGFRLRARACLFTYNSPVFLLASLESLWTSFLSFLSGLPGIDAWTATAERSMQSDTAGRLHFHAFVEFAKAVDWRSLQAMKWQDVLPNAAPCIARGPAQRNLIDRGHFYAWADKVGTEKVQTSGWEPWAGYRVRGQWLDDLWSHNKLGHATYVEYARRTRVGFAGRLQQAHAVQEHEKASALKTAQAAAAQALAPLQRPFRPDVLERLAPWRAQYAEPMPRYRFLVLFGGSRAGKSSLAKSLGTAFVQTVQNAAVADLRDYRREEHEVIIFDNVNAQSFVLDQRALFQANNDVHALGESRTGMYSYKVWLWRVPIIVTVDTSAQWDSEEPWVAANCFEVRLDGPCWAEE